MTYLVTLQTFRGFRALGLQDRIISRRQVRYRGTAADLARRERGRLMRTTLPSGTVIRVVGHGDLVEEVL